jgi:hypothetical protein
VPLGEQTGSNGRRHSGHPPANHDAIVEWKGIRVVFDITKKGDKTEIHFTHEGLVPDYECYSFCSDAWGTYIRGSLKSLIATGKGSPTPRKR